MDVTIREATAEDGDRIVLFNQAMAKETEGRMLDRGVLARGVAEDAGDIVGQLAITTEWSDWRNGAIWWIQSVYVARSHRRQGIYGQLHRHVRETARREGVVGLRLYVESDNEPAQAVYRSLGMRPSHYVMYEELWPRA